MKIPQHLLAPIVGVLAGCLGIGVGFIIRQPEINELHRQVAKLQKKADELKETVRKQNDEISALITRYRTLQVWQIIQKHDLHKQIEESLVFQYAMNDYFSLMVDPPGDRTGLQRGRDGVLRRLLENAGWKGIGCRPDGKRQIVRRGNAQHAD